ncbi:MAG: OmpH family outer membrane protein [Ferruginibacter sp.]
MKKIYSLLLVSIFIIAFTTTTAAQTVNKTGLVYSSYFEDPQKGIVKYSSAITQLNNEFLSAQKELETLQAKIGSITKEAQNLPDGAARKAKADQLANLQTDYKRKEEDARTRYNKRRNVVLGPIMQDIGKSLQDFAKANGYALVLDGDKLEESGMILAMDPAANVTEAFVKYYNGLPGNK